jgi:hypothetical protein
MMERVAEILSPSNLDMMSSIGSCLVYRRRTKEMFIHLPSFSQTNVCFAFDRDSFSLLWICLNLFLLFFYFCAMLEIHMRYTNQSLMPQKNEEQPDMRRQARHLHIHPSAQTIHRPALISSIPTNPDPDQTNPSPKQNLHSPPILNTTPSNKAHLPAQARRAAAPLVAPHQNIRSEEPDANRGQGWFLGAGSCGSCRRCRCLASHWEFFFVVFAVIFSLCVTFLRLVVIGGLIGVVDGIGAVCCVMVVVGVARLV